ncbi:hypothetical protein JB92DRAFT_3013414 [Gautieria morchelliformis]|nr:hypothetical protein JB92DRAFT_3013414 [Gautieria morchelliformis]
MLTFFVPLLLVSTVHANINLSHVRLKRIGHASHPVAPRVGQARQLSLDLLDVTQVVQMSPMLFRAHLHQLTRLPLRHLVR